MRATQLALLTTIALLAGCEYFGFETAANTGLREVVTGKPEPRATDTATDTSVDISDATGTTTQTGVDTSTGTDMPVEDPDATSRVSQAKSRIEASATVAADRQDIGGVTFFARDAQDRPLAGVSVRFQVADDGVIQLSPVSGVTNSEGIVTAGFTLGFLGEYTISTVVNGATYTSGKIRGVAGAPDPDKVSVTVTEEQTIANGSDTRGVVVLVRDRVNNPVAGVKVMLDAPQLAGRAPVNTNVNGRAAFDINRTSPGRITFKVNVADNLLPQEYVIDFLPTKQHLIDGAQVEVSSAEVVASGSDAVTLTARLVFDGLAIADRRIDVDVAPDVSVQPVVVGRTATDASGVVQYRLVSSKAGAYSVRIKDILTGAFIGPTRQVTFVAGPWADANSYLFAEGGEPTVGAPVSLLVQLRDASNNPVAGRSLEVSSSVGTDQIETVATSDLEKQAGRYRYRLEGTVAGERVINVKVDGGASVVHGATLTLAPALTDAGVSGVVAAVSESEAEVARQVVVSLRDRFGNLRTRLSSVTLEGRGADGTRSEGSASTTGQFTFSISRDTVGAVTYRAYDETAVPRLTLADQPVINWVAGPVALDKSSIVATPNKVVADGTTKVTLTATLRDAGGRPAAGRAVRFSSSRTTLDAVADKQTGSDGTVTHNVSSTVAGVAQFSVQVTATGQTLPSSAAVTFEAGPPSVTTSYLQVSPAGPNRAGDAVEVRAWLLDAQGNAVPAATVNLQTSIPNRTTIATIASAVDAAQGFYRFTYTALEPGTHELSATAFRAGGGSKLIDFDRTASLEYETGPVSAAQSTVVASHATRVAGSQATLSVVLRDGYGNPIEAEGLITVGQQGGSDLSNANGADGRFEMAVSSAVLGSVTYVVYLEDGTVPRPVVGAPVAIQWTAGPMAAAQTSLTVSATEVEALGVQAVTFTALVKDSASRLIANRAIRISSSRAGVDTTRTFVSNGSGELQFNISSTVAGIATFTMTEIDSGVSDEFTPIITFRPGPVSVVTSFLDISETAPRTAFVQGATVNVTVRDASGNAIPSADVSVTSNMPDEAVFATFTTDANRSQGIHSFSYHNKIAGVHTLTASVTVAGTSVTLTRTDTVTFVAGAINRLVSRVNGPPGPDHVGDLRYVEVQYTDVHGNEVAAAPATVLERVGVLGDVTGTTVGGVVSIPVASTVAGYATYIAWDTSVVPRQKVGYPTTIRWLAGPVDASRSGLVNTSVTVAAVAGYSATLTAVFLDAFNNPLVSAVPSYVSSRGAAIDETAVFDMLTDASGRHTVLVSSRQTGVATITASIDGTVADATAVITFVAGPPSPDHSIIHVANTTPEVSNSALTMVARVYDAESRPLSGRSLTFQAPGGQLQGPNGATTDAQGEASFVVKNTVAGAFDYTASVSVDAGVVALPVRTLTWMAASPDAAASSCSPSATTIVANGADAVVLDIVSRDRFNNRRPGDAVGIRSSRTSADGYVELVTPISSLTAADGSARVTFRSIDAGTVTLMPDISGTLLQGIAVTMSQHYSPGTVSNIHSMIEDVVPHVAADGAQRAWVRVHARNGSGGKLAGRAVTLTSARANDIIETAASVTNAEGYARFSIRSTQGGSATLSAVIQDGSSSVSVLARAVVQFGCVVDGTFYEMDASGPANNCWRCIPSVTTSAMTSYCPPTDECHDAGSCGADGLCTNPIKADGAACDDGWECSTSQCQSGQCVTADQCLPLITEVRPALASTEAREYVEISNPGGEPINIRTMQVGKLGLSGSTSILNGPAFTIAGVTTGAAQWLPPGASFLITGTGEGPLTYGSDVTYSPAGAVSDVRLSGPDDRIASVGTIALFATVGAGNVVSNIGDAVAFTYGSLTSPVPFPLLRGAPLESTTGQYVEKSYRRATDLTGAWVNAKDNVADFVLADVDPKGLVNSRMIQIGRTTDPDNGRQRRVFHFSNRSLERTQAVRILNLHPLVTLTIGASPGDASAHAQPVIEGLNAAYFDVNSTNRSVMDRCRTTTTIENFTQTSVWPGQAPGVASGNVCNGGVSESTITVEFRPPPGGDGTRQVEAMLVIPLARESIYSSTALIGSRAGAAATAAVVPATELMVKLVGHY